VIFGPDVYPVNWAALNGKVSAHWQEEEHPLEKIGRDEKDVLVSREATPRTEAKTAVNGNGSGQKTEALKR